ncbi:MAG: hypothetical protein K2X77_07855 [Candidatus Obscuribacterales bacterium]|nr:hypothetical protein [Candidatus Obscuribacterales bacterium]
MEFDFRNPFKSEQQHPQHNGSNELNSVDLLNPNIPRKSNALMDGLVAGAVTHPVEALKQVLTPEKSNEYGSQRNNEKLQKHGIGLDYQVGEIVGSLIPFIAVSCVIKGTSNRIFGQQLVPTFSRHVAEQAASGFTMGALLTPTEAKNEGNLFSARIKQGAISAGTFASMSAASFGLEKWLPDSGVNISSTVTRRASIGALSGVAGGFTDIELKTGGKATLPEITSSTLGFAVFGALMEGGGSVAGHFLRHGAQAKCIVNKPQVAQEALDEKLAKELDERAKVNLAEKSTEKPDQERVENLDQKRVENLDQKRVENLDQKRVEKPNQKLTGEHNNKRVDPLETSIIEPGKTQEEPIDSSAELLAERLKKLAKTEAPTSDDNALVIDFDAIERLMESNHKKAELLIAGQLPEFRNSVIKELRDVSVSTTEGNRFNLGSALMDTNWLKDNQKIRILDTLCTLREASKSQGAFAKQIGGEEWLRIEAALADTFTSVIKKAQNGIKPNSESLERELLANTLSQISGNKAAGPGPLSKEQNSKSVLNASRDILEHLGYTEQKIDQVIASVKKTIQKKPSISIADRLSIKDSTPSIAEQGIIRAQQDVWSKNPLAKIWERLEESKFVKSDKYPLKIWRDEFSEARFEFWDDRKKIVCSIKDKQDIIDIHRNAHEQIEIASRYNVRSSKTDPPDTRTERRFFFYDEAGKPTSISSSIFGKLHCRHGKYWYQQLDDGPSGQKARFLFKGELIVDGNGDFRVFPESEEHVIRFGLDGSKEIHHKNGRVEYRSADLETERSRLTARIKDQLNVNRFERWNSLLSDYEHVASKNLDQQALFFQQLNRLLSAAEQNPILPRQERTDLAEQVLNHAALPTTIDQGSNRTCTVATLENRLYTRVPEAAARIVADVASSGEYTTRSGIKVRLPLSATGIHPDFQARSSLRKQQDPFSEVKVDGGRDWASQLVQTILAKIPQTKKSELVSNGVAIEAERIQYNSNNELIGITRRYGLVKPIYDAAGKPLHAATPNTAVFTSKGPYLQEIDPSSLVYNEYGEVSGFLERPTIDLIPVYDKFGNKALCLDLGEHYFDQTGKNILYFTQPGELNYEKIITGATSGEKEQITLNFLGRKIHLKEELGQEIQDMDSPCLNGFKLRSIEEEVTSPAKNPYAIRRGKQFRESWKGIFVSSVEEFERALLKLSADENYPGVLAVHTSKEPWRDGQSHGNHAVNIHSYDPRSKTARLSNQWGSKYDFMDKGVSLQTIFDSLLD